MKQAFVDSLKIHDITVPSLGFMLYVPITGVGGANIRQTAYDISGAHGGYASKTRYSARVIGLSGLVYGSNPDTYDANRKALAAAFRLRQDANNIDIQNTLFFTSNNGSQYQIQGIPSNYVNDDTDVLSSPFSVSIYCGFPYFLKQAQSNQSLNIPGGGGVTVPFIVPVILSADVGGTIVCTNNGNAETYPVLTLQGPLTNPVIQNLTTGEFIKLNLTVNDGDTVVIDMLPPIPSAVLNSAQDLLSNIADGSDFWYLDVGDNQVTLSSDDEGDTGTVTIKWNDAFLNI